MKKHLALMGAMALLLPFLASCNLYSSFSSDTSDEDHRELATICLQNGDFTCAINEYQKLSDAAERNQDLCAVEVSQAGVTLDALVTDLSNKPTSSNAPLGDLTQTLMPWTQDKSTAASSAVQSCAAYQASSDSGDLGTLLVTVSMVLDCSLRIAKTDLFQAISDTDTACDTPNPDSNGIINQSDIGGDPTTGALSSSKPGMCPADVDQCRNDMISIATSLLGSSSLSNLISFYNALPAALKNSSAATDVIRLAIRGQISQ